MRSVHTDTRCSEWEFPRCVFYRRSRRPASTEFRLKGSDVCCQIYCFNRLSKRPRGCLRNSGSVRQYDSLHVARFKIHAANVSIQLRERGRNGLPWTESNCQQLRLHNRTAWFISCTQPPCLITSVPPERRPPPPILSHKRLLVTQPNRTQREELVLLFHVWNTVVCSLKVCIVFYFQRACKNNTSDRYWRCLCIYFI